MSSDALEQRIAQFARDAATDDFGALALALFARQFETLPGFRARCRELGATPDSISDWRQVPASAVGRSETSATPEALAPTAADSDGPGATFRQALLAAALPEIFRPGTLALVVRTPAEIGAQLVDAVAAAASENSLVSLGQRLDAKLLRSWLGARQRDRRPVNVVAQPEGLERLVETLERRAVKFRLPPGSAAFCAVPFAARGSESGSTARSWREAIGASLGLQPQACARVVCAPSFSTPLLEQRQGRPGRFVLPHWVRAQALEGERLGIFDLASIDAPAHRIEAPNGGFEIGHGDLASTLTLV